MGRFCSIASEVHIGSGSHPSRGTVSTHPAFYLAQPAQGWDFVDKDRQAEFRPTVVGNDVWIGAKVYGGVPARLIRKRFSDDVIDRLLKFRWWDQDTQWLRQHVDVFADIDKLISLIDRD
jgi:acetyltransferase-like isoleucine patch superfamily enzyme